MGGLAALAREAGHKVTGCDAGVYPPMSDQLKALGIDLMEGFGVEQMQLKPDLYVIGNVVSRSRLPSGEPKFPLMEAILESGAPYTSGPQWLSEHVLQGRHVLAVAGTHGKTSTTSMLTWILESAGLEPGFLVGGVPLNFGVSARLGKVATGHARNYFVIEADEYDTAFFDKRSKFVHYRPRTAILNNLEFDHADIFEDLKAIERQFHHLVRTVPGQGRLVVNALEESLTRVLAQGCWSEVRSFGAAASDFSAVGEPHHFEVLQHGQSMAQVNWRLSGVHNHLNALAAIAVAVELNVPDDAVQLALANFKGVGRRFQRYGEVATTGGSFTLVDDYGHHPVEMAATLAAARGAFPDRRLVLAFQPHRYSRTRDCFEDFVKVIAQADVVLLTEVYAAGEAPIVAADGRSLARALRVAGRIEPQFVDHIAALPKAIKDTALDGDVVLCMGAGSIGAVPAQVLELLAMVAPAKREGSAQ